MSFYEELRRRAKIAAAPPRYYMGVDLGQASDYTAIAILKQIGEPPPKAVYHLVHLERPPLRTPYPDIVERIKSLLYNPAIREHDRWLVVDATGCGRPVVDMIRQAGMRLTAVTITGGNDVTSTGAGVGVPKRNLASILQVVLQTERLKVAEGLPEASTLVNELLNFKVKISLAGKDTYEAWRENAHDDTVLAVAIALWQAERNIGKRATSYPY